jgi:phycocyanobilin:ferredoxin oxidoreductase
MSASAAGTTIEPASEAVSVLDRLQEATVASLVEPFELRPVPVERAYRERRGQWSGAELELRVQYYRGDGPLARLHLARGTSTGGVFDSLTVVTLPNARYARPLFAADLVALRDRYLVAFVDTCPLGSPVEPSPAVWAALSQMSSQLEGRALPALWQDITSPAPLFGRGRRSMGAALATAYKAYLKAFMTALEAPAPELDVREHQHRFLDRMIENKKERRSLGKLFGDEWAHRFLHGHFFSWELLSG